MNENYVYRESEIWFQLWQCHSVCRESRSLRLLQDKAITPGLKFYGWPSSTLLWTYTEVLVMGLKGRRDDLFTSCKCHKVRIWLGRRKIFSLCRLEEKEKRLRMKGCNSAWDSKGKSAYILISFHRQPGKYCGLLLVFCWLSGITLGMKKNICMQWSSFRGR